MTKADFVVPPTPVQMRPGAERRRDKRYEIDLPGIAHVAGAPYPVMISDLSAGGALISSDAGFSAGTVLSLEIKDFGALDAKVVHAGKDFFGLQFLNAHLHRDRLTAWLRAEADASRYE